MREGDRLPPKTIALFEHFFKEKLGLVFSANNRLDLERGIRERIGKLPQIGSHGDYLMFLKGPEGKEELERLVPLLTVGETYFFRNRASFEALEHVILPRVFSEREKSRTVRIWSAGCSTGEEPYSIAISVDRILPERRDWNITILGTDLNRESLEHARKGIYRPWSFRDVPPEEIEANFSHDGASYHLRPDIKAMVVFAPMNLVEDCYPSFVTQTTHQDIIICRNVMIYFSPSINKTIIDRFYDCLRPGGYLIVGHAEHNLEHFTRFRSINLGGDIIYQKPKKPALSTPLTDTASIFFRGETPPPEGSQARQIVIPHQVRCPVDSPETELFQRAVDEYKDGRHKQAIEQFRRVVAMNPHNSRALYMLAEIESNLGNLEEAEKWLRRCLDADPLMPEGWYLKGLQFREREDDRGAMLSFKRALFLKKDFSLVHFQMADLSLKQGNVSQALLYLANADKAVDDYADTMHLPGHDDLTVRRFREMIGIMKSLALKKGI